MTIDAIILSGGRSSRLGGVPKAELRYHGRSLLQLAITAAASAGRIVVVGDSADGIRALRSVDPSEQRDQAAVLWTREEPPFAGPAAAIAAGLDALSAAGPLAEHTLVLACDMPHLRTGIEALLHTDPDTDRAGDGALLIDEEGRPQPLAALYRTSTLLAAVAGYEQHGSLTGMPVRRLIAGLQLARVPAPAGSTTDVDTWTDAALFGIHHEGEEATMNAHHDEDEILDQWCERLVAELELGDLDIDIREVLGLAGRAAHSVLRPAAPLTTFVAGYAAGRAAASGQEAHDAMRQALDTARQLCRQEQTEA